MGLVITAYLAAGFIFAIAFVIRGVSAIDPGAVGSSVGFRLLLMPAAVLLWPLLAVRWLRTGTTPR
ncbi:MAG: hypothetical protein AAGC71_00040 [Pseudomonadota bacterium]